MKMRMIELDTVEVDYGFQGTEAIVEAEDGARYLIVDGYGGEHQLRGGAVRWEHGAVINILPSDTIESLRESDDYSDILRDRDDARPFAYHMKPEQVAKAAGI